MGRRALVTGGSRGIGRAAALRLARDSFDVAVGYRSRTADAESVVRACGGNAVAIEGDVRNDAEGIVQRAAAKLGGLDALVHCAVEPVRARVLELDADEWTRALETNARSLLLAARAAVDAGATRIVALSATGGHRIRNPEYAPMGIAKAAVETTVRFLAVELMPRGVTVNAVAPGPTETEAFDAMSAEAQALKERLAQVNPAGRMGRPEDVAPLIAWLCSEDAGWVTGQLIFSDGGYSLV